MALKTTVKTATGIRTRRSSRRTFVIVPVRWFWFHLIAAVVFVAAAAYAGFRAGGYDLSTRAKQVVAHYFQDLQGGMTEDELRAKLGLINQAS